MSADLRQRFEERARLLQQPQEEVATQETQIAPNMEVVTQEAAPVQQPPLNDDIKQRFLERAKAKEQEGIDTLNNNVFEKILDKSNRLISQAAIGGIQHAALPYDLAQLGAKKLAEKTAPYEYRNTLLDEMEGLLEQKRIGQWDDNDKLRYEYILDMLNNPDKMEGHFMTELPSMDVGSLIEKGGDSVGVDLRPKTIDEMALRWANFIKDPKKAGQLLKEGVTSQNVGKVMQALIPSPKEALRGAGAATALQFAAENDFGPMGTLFALAIGDTIPGMAAGGLKGLAAFAKNPAEAINSAREGLKRTAAKGATVFTSAEKKAMQQQIINDFREAGVQADLGTITGSRLFQQMQNVLEQSGLTGQALQEFRKNMTDNFVAKYKEIADTLGEDIFQSKFEAGSTLREALTEARDLEQGTYRKMYEKARSLGDEVDVNTQPIINTIEDIETEMQPGAFKSPEQQLVLRTLQEIKNALPKPTEADGSFATIPASDLINTKIGLQDIIDYEAQGGAKQLLKQVVKEIENSITRDANKNPEFAKQWTEANKLFGEHAKLFRGKTLKPIFNIGDPAQAINKMNTVNGVKQIREALKRLPNGQEVFNELARYKLADIIDKNLVDSTTHQLKFGTFSKLLQKGQNREVVKELLGREAFGKLEKLQNAAGRIAETGQKFFNSSRSGVYVKDMAFAGIAMKAAAAVLSGNPWPLTKVLSTLGGSRQLAKLISDPKFLRLVEDSILSKNQSTRALVSLGRKIADRAKELGVTLQAAPQVEALEND